MPGNVHDTTFLSIFFLVVSVSWKFVADTYSHPRQYVLFSVIYTPPPANHHGSVWLGASFLSAISIHGIARCVGNLSPAMGARNQVE
jgi:hypothetical protein